MLCDLFISVCLHVLYSVHKKTHHILLLQVFVLVLFNRWTATSSSEQLYHVIRSSLTREQCELWSEETCSLLAAPPLTHLISHHATGPNWGAEHVGPSINRTALCYIWKQRTHKRHNCSFPCLCLIIRLVQLALHNHHSPHHRSDQCRLISRPVTLIYSPEL